MTLCFLTIDPEPQTIAVENKSAEATSVTQEPTTTLESVAIPETTALEQPLIGSPEKAPWYKLNMYISLFSWCDSGSSL